MTIWIYTGDRPSNGAKELAKAPGFRRMFMGKGTKKGDVLVNWGTSKQAPVGLTVLNTPDAVQRASNKYHAFACLDGKDVKCVAWTANKAVAKEWHDAGNVIVVRTVLTGHSGAGIIIVLPDQEIPDAPLYTRYIFKTKEYRVHATRNAVIDTQQKVCPPGVNPVSWKVRSHENGFIFQRNNIAEDERRGVLAIQAVKALGLDFGAVDIVEDKKGNLYVLEVNTAPGLEGQTIVNYVDALRELAKNEEA